MSDEATLAPAPADVPPKRLVDPLDLKAAWREQIHGLLLEFGKLTTFFAVHVMLFIIILVLTFINKYLPAEAQAITRPTDLFLLCVMTGSTLIGLLMVLGILNVRSFLSSAGEDLTGRSILGTRGNRNLAAAYITLMVANVLFWLFVTQHSVVAREISAAFERVQR